MKEIFRLKSKLHLFINYAFYFLFFLVGYLIGGGKLEKIMDIFNINW